MSNPHEGQNKGFYLTSESHYGPTFLAGQDYADQLMIGFYDGSGNTTGEFAIRWWPLGNQVQARLEVYQDNWDTLTHFPEVITLLQSLAKHVPSPQHLVQQLLDLGFTDYTERPTAGPDDKPTLKGLPVSEPLLDDIEAYNQLERQMKTGVIRPRPAAAQRDFILKSFLRDLAFHHGLQIETPELNENGKLRLALRTRAGQLNAAEFGEAFARLLDDYHQEATPILPKSRECLIDHLEAERLLREIAGMIRYPDMGHHMEDETDACADNTETQANAPEMK